jgi:hypothetical protein
MRGKFFGSVRLQPDQDLKIVILPQASLPVSNMTAPRMRTWTLTAVLWGCLFCVAVQGQRPIAQPEVLAGPWEVTDASGIDGIFLDLSTHARGTAEQPVITSQSISIRVYHRKKGHETWGWYSAATSAGTADAGTMFDGRHLRIENDRVGLFLDVSFDAGAHLWTGTWARDGQPRDVVLERPHPPGSAPSPFAGEWEGFQGAPGLQQGNRLHIAQSSDGTLTAWLDRVIALIDQRHGELLSVESSGHDTITLETTNAAGVRDGYHGMLSEDGSTVAGSWRGPSGSGRTFNASTSFRRIR